MATLSVRLNRPLDPIHAKRQRCHWHCCLEAMDSMVTNEFVHVSHVCPNIDLNSEVIIDTVGNIRSVWALCRECYIISPALVKFEGGDRKDMTFGVNRKDITTVVLKDRNTISEAMRKGSEN